MFVKSSFHDDSFSLNAAQFYLIRQTFFIQTLNKNIQLIQFNKGITHDTFFKKIHPELSNQQVDYFYN